MRLEPLLAEIPKALAALDSLSAASVAQESVAPLAVKVKLTDPGATRGAAPNGMAEDAPGVVSTVVGSTKLLEALVPLVCVGEASATVVKTLAPLAWASSTLKALAEPLYCTGATVVPRRKDCKADAVPPSTRLEVPEPLSTEIPPSAAADKLPEAVLKVRVSASSAAVLPSSSAASVNNKEEFVPAVTRKVVGTLTIEGARAEPLEIEAGCTAEMLAVLVDADCTTPPEMACAVTTSE